MNIPAGNVSTNNPQSIDGIRVRFSRNGPNGVENCTMAALRFIELAKKLKIPEDKLRVTIKDLGNGEFEFRLTKRRPKNWFVHHSWGNQKSWYRLFKSLNLPMPAGCRERSSMPKSHMSLDDLSKYLNVSSPRYHVHNLAESSCEIKRNAVGRKRLSGGINKLLDHYKMDYTTDVLQDQSYITVKHGNYATKIPIDNDSSTTGIHLSETEQKTFGDLYKKINAKPFQGLHMTSEECRICGIITDQIDELIKSFSSLGHYRTFFIDNCNAKNIKVSKIVSGCEITFNKDGYNRLSDKANIQLAQSPNQKTSEYILHLQTEKFECSLASLDLNDDEQNALKTLIETVNKNEKDSVDPTPQQIFLCNKVITKLDKMMQSDPLRKRNFVSLFPHKISMTNNPSVIRNKILEYCTEVRKYITSRNENCKPGEKLSAFDFWVKILIDEKKKIATLFLLPTNTGFNHKKDYQQSRENFNKLLGENIDETDTPLHLFHLQNFAISQNP